MSDEKIAEEQFREVLGEAVGILGEQFDREKIVDYLYEFLSEAVGKPPSWVIPEKEAAAAAYTLLEDLARAEPLLVSAKVSHGGELGVPRKTAEIFTWGMVLGVYLAAKGAAQWPTKILNS